MESTSLAILRAVYAGQPITRRELGARVGLSPGRISTLAGQLLAQHLLCEEAFQDGTPGRPAGSLSLNPQAGRLAGLDIGGRQSRATLCGLGGGLVATITQPTRVTADRAEIVGQIAELVDAVCRRGGTRPGELLALGIGVQGIVDSRSGVVIGWPNTPAWAPAWTGLDLAAELRGRLGNELVVVDDSVRAMGTTASRLGPARGSQGFLYVYLGDGVGAGFFVNGHPYYSSTGLAGELGHVSIREDGPSCSCGNRGCLEVLASVPAVLQRVRERLAESWLASTLREACERDELTLAVLIEAAKAGDKLAFQVLDEAGSYVGRVVAIALNLSGSELVVLGGPLAQDGGIILDAVQRQIRLRALGHISRQTRVVCDDQGELAGAQGAALLALDALFGSAKHLNSLLGAAGPGAA